MDMQDVFEGLEDELRRMKVVARDDLEGVDPYTVRSIYFAGVVSGLNQLMTEEVEDYEIYELAVGIRDLMISECMDSEIH